MNEIRVINENHLMAVLFAAYPVETVNVSEDGALMSAKLYAASLADIDGTIVIEAIDRLVKSSIRLPTIAHIRRAVLDIRYGSPRSGVDAWGDLRELMQKHAGRRLPGRDFVIEDKILEKTVEALGWTELLQSENRTADRARFIELYNHLTNEERTEAAAAKGVKSDSWPAKQLPASEDPPAVMKLLLPDLVKPPRISSAGRR